MSELKTNRIVETFNALRDDGKKALVPYITACWPGKAETVALLHEFEKQGVRICELGVPYSDPVADGPTIQASFTEALSAGVKVADVFDAVRTYREEGGGMAMLAMLSYSIVHRCGVGEFCQKAASAGLDGLIVPDLSFGASDDLAAQAASAGLCNVLLIAPTTTPERREQIAKASSGFIYYISVAGITGARTELPAETLKVVAELETHAETPICVGFGISNAAMVQAVCDVADGAIVGSAIVKAIGRARDEGLSGEALAKNVGGFVGELLSPIK